MLFRLNCGIKRLPVEVRQKKIVLLFFYFQLNIVPHPRKEAPVLLPPTKLTMAFKCIGIKLGFEGSNHTTSVLLDFAII